MKQTSQQRTDGKMGGFFAAALEKKTLFCRPSSPHSLSSRKSHPSKPYLHSISLFSCNFPMIALFSRHLSHYYFSKIYSRVSNNRTVFFTNFEPIFKAFRTCHFEYSTCEWNDSFMAKSIGVFPFTCLIFKLMCTKKP